MYSLKVRASLGPGSEAQQGPGSEASAVSHAAEARSGDGEQGVEDQVPFSAGNPRVEHITGVVHLYRILGEEQAAAAQHDEAAAARQQHQRRRQEEEWPPLPGRAGSGGGGGAAAGATAARQSSGDGGEISPAARDGGASPFAPLAFPVSALSSHACGPVHACRGLMVFPAHCPQKKHSALAHTSALCHPPAGRAQRAALHPGAADRHGVCGAVHLSGGLLSQGSCSGYIYLLGTLCFLCMCVGRRGHCVHVGWVQQLGASCIMQHWCLAVAQPTSRVH